MLSQLQRNDSRLRCRLSYSRALLSGHFNSMDLSLCMCEPERHSPFVTKPQSLTCHIRSCILEGAALFSNTLHSDYFCTVIIIEEGSAEATGVTSRCAISSSRDKATAKAKPIVSASK